MGGTAKIISYNTNAHDIISAAGRISTTLGGADEIYEKSVHKDDEVNLKLIEKILSSGHESILEHVSINLSFDDVSVFVEQFMIEFRLASFTVKSRRYVNFGEMGHVSPDFSKYGAESDDIKKVYQSHMEYLFDEYNFFVERGVPKEDARFVLPYSFRSNFYCTVNGRQLIKIMNEMIYGRGRNYDELVNLGWSIFRQCEEKLPYLAVRKEQCNDFEMIGKCCRETGEAFEQVGQAAGLIDLIQDTAFPEKIVCRAAALNYGIANWEVAEVEDIEQQREMISMLLKKDRKRELEQVNFTVLFRNISLAGITHLVRHRMQSIIVPEYIRVCNFEKYVMPQSIVGLGMEDRYKKGYEKSKEVAEYLDKSGLSIYDKVYLMLSGMTISVMTTMNANELYTFIRLRTCNRAQWEIKAYADALLRCLRERHPVLFSFFGPSCYITGECPEGRMSCGRISEVQKLYGEGGR